MPAAEQITFLNRMYSAGAGLTVEFLRRPQAGLLADSAHGYLLIVFLINMQLTLRK
jgi:hypothetical protein